MINKKDYTEEFLTEFKNIEQLITQIYGTNTTFRDVEQTFESSGNSDISKKMYLCRVIRNYVSHNPDINSFMPISEASCLYLRKLYEIFKREIKTVKDSMSRTKPLLISDNIVQGAKRLLKFSSIPVVDDAGLIIGIFNYEVLNKCVCDEMSLKTKFSKGIITLSQAKKCSYAMPSEPMKDVFERMTDNGLDIVFVTADGTQKSKFIGTVMT